MRQLDSYGQSTASPESSAAPAHPPGLVDRSLELEAQLAELKRHKALQTAVNQSFDQLVACSKVIEVLPEILTQLSQLVGIDRVAVLQLHRGEPDPIVSAYYRWKTPAAPEFSDHAQITQQFQQAEQGANFLQRGQAVHLSRSNHGVRHVLEAIGVASLLFVPVTVHSRQWGIVAFEDCHGEHDWFPEEVETLTAFANLIGVAITRESSFEELRVRDELMHAVTLSASEIITAPYLHEAVSKALENVAKAVGAERAFVLESTPGPDGTVQLVHRNSWPGDAPLPLDTQLGAGSHEYGAAYLAWTAPLATGSVVCGHASTAPAAIGAHLGHLNVKSTLRVPVLVDGKYWGQIGFDSCAAEREWRPAEIDILKTLAGFIGTAITRERYIEELSNANAIVQNSPTILYRLRGEPSFPMIFVSQNISLLGYRAADLLKSPTLYQSYVHPDDRPRVQARIVELLRPDNPALTVEYRMLTSTGAIRWVESRLAPVRDIHGRLMEVEGVMVDLTERKLAEDKIAQLARTDALTGLANRATLNDRLKHAFAATKRGAAPFGVLYLDLDHFKDINDTLGHPVGDRLLQLAAERLRGLVREVDLAARLGGDEFAVLQADCIEPEAAGALARTIIDSVSRPYLVDGNELRIGVSVGISLHDAANASADELLAQADRALYRAKEEGRGQYRFHTAALDQETRERVALTEDLRTALDRRELELYYQPQIELSTGRVTGMEALLRWNHPKRGLLLPQDFLPSADKSGIVPALGRWVLEGACAQLRAWRDAGAAVPVIAVNVGLAQVRGGGELVRDVQVTLARHGLQPQDLEIDVTELILARATLAQSNVLEQLHRLGVRIAIDDFGTQYSSLDYLRMYHVSRLKIARSVVRSAGEDRAGSAMIRAIMSLASELDVEVIAEGIETEEQRRELMTLRGATRGQGFLFSTPIPAPQVLDVLRERGISTER